MMASLRTAPAEAGTFLVIVPEPGDFDVWRERARGLVQRGVTPERVEWSEPGGTVSLFAAVETAAPPAPALRGATEAPMVRASKPFVELAQSAICHSNPERFALLYRLLWRLQADPRLMEDRADPDVRRIDEFARAVRRDIHKMRAFVRFRRIGEGDAEHYVAWFEPEHFIVERNAPCVV